MRQVKAELRQSLSVKLMAKYRLCFLDSGEGFSSESSFEGTAAEALKEAQRISLVDFQGDYTWWVEADGPQAPDKEMWKNMFSTAAKFEYHELDQSALALLMMQPSYTDENVLYRKADPEKISHADWMNTSEFILTHYDAYNGKEIVGKGKGHVGSSEKPHLVTNSVITVGKLVYELCLARKKDVTHIVCEQRHRTRNGKIGYVGVEVYEFAPDEDSLVRHMKNVTKKEIERTVDFYRDCNRLRLKGTTRSGE